MTPTSSWLSHHVAMGSAIIAYIGGLHHWWPKMFGRCTYQARERDLHRGVHLVQPHLPHGQGRGMPRRYYEYIASYQTLNQIATVGPWDLTVVTLGYPITGIWAPVASRNPWNVFPRVAYSDTPIETTSTDSLVSVPTTTQSSQVKRLTRL